MRKPGALTRLPGSLTTRTYGSRDMAKATVSRSYVYVIGEIPPGALKIGLTQDVIHRLRTLQTGNPRELVLLLVGYMDSRVNALRLERRLHCRFATSWLRGEWFDVAVQDVESYLVERHVRIVPLANVSNDRPMRPLIEMHHPLSGLSLGGLLGQAATASDGPKA